MYQNPIADFNFYVKSILSAKITVSRKKMLKKKFIIIKSGTNHLL